MEDIPISTIQVAIIVPVYNVEDYLPQCLDSICAQTLSNIMIICVNDGSTDNSPTILKTYQEKDTRIHVITQENKGLGLARNTGIEYALKYTPQYIGFVDSDDFIEPTMYEKLYTKATQYNADIAYCNVQLYDNVQGNTEIWEYKSPSESYYIIAEYTKNIYYIKVSSVWDSIYSYDLVHNNEIYFTKGFHEDTLWFLACFTSAHIATHVPEALYIYRQNRAGSIMNCITHSDPIIKLSSLLKNYIDCFQWLLEHNNEERYYNDIYTFITNSIASFLSEIPEETIPKCLTYIQTYFPYAMYTYLDTHLLKRKPPTFLESIFSVRKSPLHKCKILTICGFQIRIPMKEKS